MTDAECQLISRKQFLGLLAISDSNERRKRRASQAWPPHLRIGNKVYYRRAAVEDDLRAQELAEEPCPASSDHPGPGEPDLIDEVGDVDAEH